jgi:LmbE family N-acetylglucosaminyl deacetylase
MANQVVVIAPHPDDEVIGCGGVICKHRRNGDSVRVIFLTSGEQGNPDMQPESIGTLREEEARKATQLLDVCGLHFLRLPDQAVAKNMERGVRRLRELFSSQPPDVVYAPHPAEAHRDHAPALPFVRGATANLSTPRVLLYEVWTPLSNPTRFEDITEFMSPKMRALRCYRSQLELIRYDHAVRGLNRFRGVMSGGCRYAEAFAEPDR